jgi:hypothetical protein
VVYGGGTWMMFFDVGGKRVPLFSTFLLVSHDVYASLEPCLIGTMPHLEPVRERLVEREHETKPHGTQPYRTLVRGRKPQNPTGELRYQLTRQQRESYFQTHTATTAGELFSNSPAHIVPPVRSKFACQR